MNHPNYGKASYFATGGATCITSSNAAIIGVLFQGTATGTLQIWAGTTATGAGALSGIIRAFVTGAVTMQSAVWYPFPANASGGITINVGTSADPSLTLFWNPVGGP